MGDDLAASNVNRSYSLAATSIAIFAFMLFFLYPRFASGQINALLFQVTLVVMGVATFSFVFCLVAIPIAFVNSWLAGGLYVLVAMMWLVPDRRIEKMLSH